MQLAWRCRKTLALIAWLSSHIIIYPKIRSPVCSELMNDEACLIWIDCWQMKHPKMAFKAHSLIFLTELSKVLQFCDLIFVRMQTDPRRARVFRTSEYFYFYSVLVVFIFLAPTLTTFRYVVRKEEYHATFENFYHFFGHLFLHFAMSATIVLYCRAFVFFLSCFLNNFANSPLVHLENFCGFFVNGMTC